MPQLESLYVCGRDRERLNLITDEGLKQLAGLDQLTDLGIQNTEVSDGGVKAFSTAHPGCRVVR